MNLEKIIGNSPLVALGSNLLAKLEFTNLTGSVKDRAARAMIRAAIDGGQLRPGHTIIEPTSGNFGISLAALGAKFGYVCVIVMPENMSPERRRLMEAYGAKVILSPGEKGMAGAVALAEELAGNNPNCWMPRQFENPANPMAHYHGTGPEIWEQSQGKVDVFVAGVGTGGTITGVGRYLKEQNSNISIVAVEPASSPLLSQGRAGSHCIQGIGPNFVPKVLGREVVDDIYLVTAVQAQRAARSLARRGLLCGISSGAAYHAAQSIAQSQPEKTVVTLFPDSGNRYLSMGLYE